MLKIVLDTNVLVSALHKSKSNPALILSLILNQHLKLCLTQEIFNEYRGVLGRKKFAYLNHDLIDNILNILNKKALWVTPQTRIDVIKKDPADNRFLECALTVQADFLITGNINHFDIIKFHTTLILTPTEFIETIASSLSFRFK